MLIDYDRETAYVPISLRIVTELREKWSEPCQVRVENDMLVIRSLGQPVKGVYIVPDSNQDSVHHKDAQDSGRE